MKINKIVNEKVKQLLNIIYYMQGNMNIYVNEYNKTKEDINIEKLKISLDYSFENINKYLTFLEVLSED